MKDLIALDAIVVVGACEFQGFDRYHPVRVNLVDLLDHQLQRDGALLFSGQGSVPFFLNTYFQESTKNGVVEFIKSLQAPENILVVGALCGFNHVRYSRYKLDGCVGSDARKIYNNVSNSCRVIIDKHVVFDLKEYRTHATYQVVKGAVYNGDDSVYDTAVVEKIPPLDFGFKWKHWPNKKCWEIK